MHKQKAEPIRAEHKQCTYFALEINHTIFFLDSSIIIQTMMMTLMYVYKADKLSFSSTHSE